MQGSEFLTQPKDYSPRTPEDVQIYLTPTLKFQLLGTLLDLTETAPDCYMLKKRAAYPPAFSEYIRQKVKKEFFQVSKLNSAYLNAAMQRIVRYVQRECFGKMMQAFCHSSPDALEDVINKFATHTTNDSVRKHLADLRSMRCLRPCIYPDNTLRIEDRLSQSELPTDEKLPISIPSRHPFTRLLVLRVIRNALMKESHIL